MQTKDQRTVAIRTGHRRTDEGEHSLPIFSTSSFVFKNARQAADRFSETEAGNIYSRFTNPTTRAFEERLAALEGADYCIATASGMSAISTLCFSMLKSGDRIVAARGLFGSTISLFANYLTQFNIGVDFVGPTDIDGWSNAIQPSTRMLFIETPSNPLCDIVDIAKLAEIASSHRDCMLVVDNCACTPALQRPIDLGADVVVHSATKFLDGQGRGVGGAIVTCNHDIAAKAFGYLRTAGPAMSPFNAWIFFTGMETLALRMYESSRSTQQIAQWLAQHDAVSNVYYPGLPNHTGHELAARQQSAFGAILSFDVAGGRKNAWQVIDSTSLVSITGNLGDVKTTITHPASTTHARISEKNRRMCGITEDLIRMSIGLEAADDIIADLDSGLSRL